MVLLNPFERVVIAYVDAGLYLIQLTFLCMLLDRLPVRLTVGVQRLLTKLPGSFHTGLLLQAVGRRAVIFLNGLEMRHRVVFLHSGQPVGPLHTHIRLDVHRTFLAFLQLSVNIGRYCGPLLEVFFGVAFGVVMRD